MNDNSCGKMHEASEGVELDAGRYDVGGGHEVLFSLPRDCLDQSDIALYGVIIMRYNNIACLSQPSSSSDIYRNSRANRLGA